MTADFAPQSDQPAQYRYVARFHLDRRAEHSSLVHFLSMDELIDWAKSNSMAPGKVTRGTNFYEARHTDGSPLSAEESRLLPKPHDVEYFNGNFTQVCRPVGVDTELSFLVLGLRVASTNDP